MTRRKYVVGNWKMNGLSDALAEAQAIFAAAADHPGVDPGRPVSLRGTSLDDCGIADRPA